MITKELLELLFEAASIQRWNDHNRPEHFTELDKQAHKMIYAYVLAKFEETDRGMAVDWCALIEGFLFEYLHRVVLTDIKPPVFHRLMAEKGAQLNEWVLEQLNEQLAPLEGGFFERMKGYLRCSEENSLEKKILRAAHYLATNWEFKLIYHLNAGIYGLEETRHDIENQLEEHYDLAGVQKLNLNKKTGHFLDLVGQLRFQQRWAQSPRLPKTSVLGHMLIVAAFSYFCSLEIAAVPQRKKHNFLGGLFHDLPEVLTRDIISPVKRSVKGLDLLIKEIEQRQMEERIYPLLPASWHREIKFFTENEFAGKIIKEGRVHFVSSDEINERYNEDCYTPLDGEIIRACDQLAAYMETYLSISYGIKSPHLEEANRQLYETYRQCIIAGIDFSRLFGFFYISK
ncbi:MAG: HD domain-containing protein [Dethiobacteria bacterium]|jgi:putative hydrolase of HD superfamily|nr:HD domain-containing protein [Bacillota bacterium]NMD32671.1 HD domain-containing protein [Bacillota bacterium]HOB28419.1 HD domain-containing protein [Bacillota bacterium]HPZ41201.1 HD domain-containing protein [Bacillota bacterium]HQD51971.1 HD domain-containing protein [Bacillota bacterium]